MCRGLEYLCVYFEPNSFKKTSKHLGDELARRIEKIEGLEYGWLDKSQESNIVDIAVADDQPANEYAFIPLLSAKAAAGDGCDNMDILEDGSLAFRRDWMRRNYLKEENLRLIRAQGESMEPVIHDDSYCIMISHALN